MLGDMYFETKQELTQFAVNFREIDLNNWYVRTTFECGHDTEHRKQGILLIRNERCIQRLIICPRCKKRVDVSLQYIIHTEKGGNDGSN